QPEDQLEAPIDSARLRNWTLTQAELVEAPPNSLERPDPPPCNRMTENSTILSLSFTSPAAAPGTVSASAATQDEVTATAKTFQQLCGEISRTSRCQAVLNVT
ncbi:hypothetical protein BGW38_005997, partial [Lunasporangiospora selenospora]